jgi:hypothetical protein
MRHRRDNRRHWLARTGLEGDLDAILTVSLQRSGNLEKRDFMRPHLSGLAALLSLATSKACAAAFARLLWTAKNPAADRRPIFRQLVHPAACRPGGLPQILKRQPRLHDILQEQRIDGCADGLTASSRRTALESQRQRGVFADQWPPCSCYLYE